MPLARGDVYAGYTIVHLILTGPSGSVYLATGPGDPTSWFALKILRADVCSDADFRRRVLRTTESVAGFDDPAAAQVHRFGTEEGTLWVATEYVDGMDAGRLLRQRFPSGIPHQSLCIIADHVAGALDRAHARGVAHGDVKPSNILVGGPFSKSYRILLTDFGHGRLDESEDPQQYPSPEVLAGGIADARADQFALAATAFHLLTAAPAFPGAARVPTEDEHIEFDTHTLRARSAGLDGLDYVFARAFAVDPADRYDSCSEFVTELSSPGIERPRSTQLPRSVGAVRADTAAPKPSSLRTRRSIVVPAVAAVVIAVALTVAAVVFGKPHPNPSSAPGPATDAASGVPAVAPPPDACAKLDAVVSQLSLRQKLAQLLMVGVTDIDDATAVVSNYEVGGIFVASWTDLSMLRSGALRDLQARPAPLPLAVSVDEEGGRVQRLKDPSLLGPQDSARELVADGATPQQVHDIAFEHGTKMKSYGITIDFAPVVDVSNAPANTVIGDRSFSSDPATVVIYAGEYARGLRDAGLLPVLKHFPGHGRASGDSHQGSVTTPPLSDLMTLDLIPYQELTTHPPVAVMVGHMQVPGLTGTDPASLSGAAYSLLRDGRYGGPPFGGLIFTDDLSSMGAITQHYPVPDAVLRAVQAGADVALWVSTEQVPDVLNRLVQAVDNHELDMARVDDALSHVAVAKNPELACQR